MPTQPLTFTAQIRLVDLGLRGEPAVIQIRLEPADAERVMRAGLYQAEALEVTLAVPGAAAAHQAEVLGLREALRVADATLLRINEQEEAAARAALEGK